MILNKWVYSLYVLIWCCFSSWGGVVLLCNEAKGKKLKISTFVNPLLMSISNPNKNILKIYVKKFVILKRFCNFTKENKHIYKPLKFIL